MALLLVRLFYSVVLRRGGSNGRQVLIVLNVIPPNHRASIGLLGGNQAHHMGRVQLLQPLTQRLRIAQGGREGKEGALRERNCACVVTLHRLLERL